MFTLQVSRLVILHEEAEDGNAMPDLERPVMAVSRAVTNLVKVGRETINSSEDAILKQDMPAALVRVEGASRLLEEASAMLKVDPYSGPARKKLIEGSRGILQGTSALLLCFDESEVRKIIRECKRVLDYLAVSREVGGREKELTHQVHREILVRCLEQVKTLAPILICSMKIFIHIIAQGGKGAEEAAENRNYLAQRMTDELNEIIRVLQLTTYDEEEWDADNLTDPLALRGGVGEKSVRQILEHAQRVCERALPGDADAIRKLCGDITTMTDALCELRQDGKGASPQAECLAHGIQEKLGDLCNLVQRAVVGVEKSGVQQPAHTVSGRLEQARRWLAHPDRDDRGLGQQAIALIVTEGKKVADGLPGVHKAEILGLCDEVDILSRQLSDLCRRGHGDTPQAQDVASIIHGVARTLSQKLYELKDRIQNAVVSRVVEDFIDIGSPLKHFTDAVHVPQGTPGREQNFNDRAQQLQQFSTRAAKTARMVAAGGSSGNKKLAEALLSSASQVESLTPQLVSAGRIRMNYPESKAADEHFQNLVAQYSDSVQHVRALCDEATDSADFIKMSGVTPMVQDAKAVAINMADPVAACRWRESNRALLAAVGEVRHAVTVTPDLPPPPDMSSLHMNVGSTLREQPTPEALSPHRTPCGGGRSVSPLPKWARDYAPPRPPLPGGEVPPPRPPPPETDDEDDMFLHAPLPNQPIMMAAHGLHQEVRQWSSKDNDIIVAAKKMAVLMGRLSQLVRGEGGSSKRDLISCAKSIAEASEEVTQPATGL
ncbi:Vinculin [Blattella germanica]|nr:Vinculin [Blattella germanica]